MQGPKTNTQLSSIGLRILAVYFSTVFIFNLPVFAATSSTYSLDNDQAGPTQFRQTSGSYTLDGSIEPIVGNVTSSSYGNEQGSPTRVESTSATAPTGGGGGAPAQTGKITVDNVGCTVVYDNLVHFTGTKTKNLIYMFVRGDLSGFYFPDETHWEKTVWINNNESTVYDFFGRDLQGKSSAAIELTLTLHRMGDINGDGKTDDYDLSLLARAWNSRNSCDTDLNRDGITDDYDLSLLASYWSVE